MSIGMGKRRLELDENDRCLPYFYDLPQPPQMVQSARSLTAFAESLRKAVLMAIDSERKPNSRSISRKTELLQISLRDARHLEECFILDLQVLSRDKGLVMQLNRHLATKLNDETCIKIGHGIANDFQEVYRSHDLLTAFGTAHSLFDTNLVYRSMHPEHPTDVSLKFLTRAYLHFNLIKTQQLTDWSARPLTESQVYYAACDSTVLLRLYDEMDFDFKEHQRRHPDVELQPRLTSLIIAREKHVA